MLMRLVSWVLDNDIILIIHRCTYKYIENINDPATKNDLII